MNPPVNMTRIVNGKRYSTNTATLIADDVYWDGHNMERNFRNSFLYRTPNNNYFLVTLTQWQGERDALVPVSVHEAMELYETVLPEHHLEYEAAFIGAVVEDA